METWTITESLKKRIGGCYSRMLRPFKRGLERTSHQQGGLWITPKSEFEDTGLKDEVGWEHPAT